MKEIEKNKIGKSIESELDIETLLEINHKIENQIDKILNLKSEKLTNEQENALLRGLTEYCDDIRVKNGTIRLRYSCIRIACYKALGMHYGDKLLVYHLIKTGVDGLTNAHNIGEKTIALLETELNKDNLSLYKPVVDDKIEMKVKMLNKELN